MIFFGNFGAFHGDIMVGSCSFSQRASDLQAEEPMQASTVGALAPVLTWLRVELTNQVSLGIINHAIYKDWEDDPPLSQTFWAQSSMLKS